MTYAPTRTITVEVSAYNSCPEQCSGNHFITASGLKLQAGDKVVATNFLPFGTKVNIDGVLYRVEDRMAERYNRTIDIWFGACSPENIRKAKAFGRQIKEIKVYE